MLAKDIANPRMNCITYDDITPIFRTFDVGHCELQRLGVEEAANDVSGPEEDRRGKGCRRHVRVVFATAVPPPIRKPCLGCGADLACRRRVEESQDGSCLR